MCGLGLIRSLEHLRMAALHGRRDERVTIWKVQVNRGGGYRHRTCNRAQRQGLVVGQVAGMSAFGLATSAAVPVALTVGRFPPTGGSVHRGYVLFKRGEGNHKLTDLFGTNGRVVVHLPIGREFAVRKGEITVLGLMYFLQNPDDKKAFRVVAFDNREETIDYLRRTHPAVIAGHDSAAVVLAPGNYLPMERLVQLRTAVARQEARRAKRQGQFWVAGRAGTLAEVQVTGDSVQVLRFLPPATYQEPLRNAYDAQGVLTFASQTQQWRVVNGAVEEIPRK
jgi:hypothetical protein